MCISFKITLIGIRKYVIKLQFRCEVAAGDLMSTPFFLADVSSQFHHVTQKMRETRGDTGNIATTLHQLT